MFVWSEREEDENISVCIVYYSSIYIFLIKGDMKEPIFVWLQSKSHVITKCRRQTRDEDVIFQRHH